MQVEGRRPDNAWLVVEGTPPTDNASLVVDGTSTPPDNAWMSVEGTPPGPTPQHVAAATCTNLLQQAGRWCNKQVGPWTRTAVLQQAGTCLDKEPSSGLAGVGAVQ